MNETSILERLIEVVSELPEEYALEVLDFAEFLQAKQEEELPMYPLTESTDVRDILEAMREMKLEGELPGPDVPGED